MFPPPTDARQPDLAVSVEYEDGDARRLRIAAAVGGSLHVAGTAQAGGHRRSAACSTPGRLLRAARWVLDLDPRLAEQVAAGEEAVVEIGRSPRSAAAAGRAWEDSLAAYRSLRLDVGELVRPGLRRPPRLDSLYPFQREGVEWLRDRDGAILADDMGVGKTVQVIFAMRQLFQQAAIRGALVLCPKSLVDVWDREITRWAPELGAVVLSPPGRIREQAWRTILGRRHVVITNYEQLREPPAVLLRAETRGEPGASSARSNGPPAEPLDLLVADEAHRLRNFGSRVASGIDRIPRRRFWALTGTPIERDLEDLATLLSLVAPRRFAPSDSRLHPSSLRSAARSYILRRRKDEVLKELPPVVDRTEDVELTPEQSAAYRATLAAYRENPAPGAELALLTKLGLLCDVEEESGASSKLDWIAERLREVRRRGEKAVVFSHRLPPLGALEGRLAERWDHRVFRRLDGSMGRAERDLAVRDFRNDPSVFVLAASSRVGGEGLTLVEANHLFLVNQWWNPSANDQARDRVVRIGQKRTVHVYRFCCRGTIEQRLQEILKAKRALFADAVEGFRARTVLREEGIASLIGGGFESFA